MATSSSYDFCFLVLCAILLITTSCHGYSHVPLFIFGDSLYDAGNNNDFKNSSHRANFPPYGETFFGYPTGRACDGRLIPDFIAEYAKLPLIPSYLPPGNDQYINGANFASNGAGALVETNRGLVIDLKTQLSYFMNVEKQLRQQLGDKEAEKELSKAVYMFSIGGNDYFVAISPNSTMLQLYSKQEYVRMVLANITTVIQEIYKKGGRKFGFSKLINLGCLPFLRTTKTASTGRSGCVDEATSLAKLHNRELSKTLTDLERRLEGFRYSNFDAYTAGKERIDSPSKYGFIEVDDACCGTGLYRGGSPFCGQKGYQYLCDNVEEHFFFDAFHPTEKANYQFADLMWSGSTHYVKPYNLKSFFE